MQDPIVSGIPPEAYAMMAIGAFGLVVSAFANLGGWSDKNLSERMKNVLGAIGAIMFVFGLSGTVLLLVPAVIERIGSQWGEVVRITTTFLPVLLIASILIYPFYRILNRRFPDPQIEQLKQQHGEQHSSTMEMINKLINIVQDIQKGKR